MDEGNFLMLAKIRERKVGEGLKTKAKLSPT